METAEIFRGVTFLVLNLLLYVALPAAIFVGFLWLALKLLRWTWLTWFGR